jgi:hypothetical protein
MAKLPKIPTAEMKKAVEEFKKQFTGGFYHGSPSPDIKAFDPTKSAKDPMYVTPKATFVTRDPEFAESFLSMANNGRYKTGATMYPVSVNLGQHWNPGTPEGQQLIQDFIQKYPKRVNLEKGLKRGDWTAIENSDFLTHLKDTGHDTFHVMEGGIPNVGVLKPENIRGKFADFDPAEAASPEFMKAAGGAVEGYQAGGLTKLLKHAHGQNPKVAQALEEYLKGNISQEDRIRILNQNLPIRKWSDLPPNYTDEQIRNALMANKQAKALTPVPVGAKVGNRLDIPAYTQHGVYVDTTHDVAGKPISYGRTGHLKDVEFSSKPNQAVRVGLGTKEQALTPMGAEIGSAKSPFALIKGTNVGTSDEEVRRMMEEMLKDPRYTQIGMDPRRHSQFYDKETGMPVWAAEEKLQSGPLILAPKQGLETTSWDDPRLNLSDFEGKKYQAGGAIKLAKQIAPKFSLEAIKKMPVGSAAKQTPVAKAFQMLSSENVDPKIKQQIFQDYISKHPELIKKSGATNYDELTQAAYQKMIQETKDQFDAMTGAGIKLSWDPTGAQGYKNSAEMLKDASENKHLTVFQGGDPHPLIPNEANEQFRAVHDYFGHGTTGSSFGPKGEELAYGAHSQMYSPLARLAAATETRGQNSFVNYSGINDELIKKINEAKARGASPEELQKLNQQWQYAPQKGLILPSEQIDLQYTGYAPGGSVIKKALEHAKSLPFVHYSTQPALTHLDPAMYGRGIKGAEAARLKNAPDIKPRSYFYVNKGEATRAPEAGLGSHKYEGMAEDIYPLHEDPAGFGAIAKQKAIDPYMMSMGRMVIDEPTHLNELERLIKGAGYKGYAGEDAGLLFHPTEVKKITD